MRGGIRLWSRDRDVVAALRRWPLTNAQIAALCKFSSTKKASERTKKLFGAALITRGFLYLDAMQGKPAWLYGAKRSQLRERTMAHDHWIAELHVAIAAWLPTSTWEGEFFYTHEVGTRGGIIADAVLILRKGERRGLFLLEVDTGAEPLLSAASYSVAKKLDLYAAYYDDRTFVTDFASAGTFDSFRTCVIVPAGRQKHLMALLREKRHDFVMVTSFDRLQEGLAGPIWETIDAERVDLLGRTGE